MGMGMAVDDNGKLYNEYESAAKKPKTTTSKVWLDMTKLECEDKTLLKAQCNHSDELILCLLQWNINKKISSITLDNASYNDVLVSSLKSRFRANMALLCDGAFFQIRCCGHILNLIVQAGLKLIDDVVGKVRNGIKHIKKSGPRKKRFYEIAEKSFHLNVTRKLHQDVCVGWNSTYLMLESALYFKDVLVYWGLHDKDFKIFALSDEEWGNVNILCKFLKVFYDVTCIFSGSKYPTSNIYFRGVWKVHNVLLDTANGPHTFLTPMVKEMQEKFNKYWVEYSLVLSCATILDPRYKLNYVEYCYTKLYGEHSHEFVQTVLNTLRILFDEYLKVAQCNSSSLIGNSTMTGASILESTQHDSNVSGAALDETEDYKAFLKYWSKSSIWYSELSLLARDLLAIPISTIASESAFSVGKLKVINYMRSSLKPKIVQAVVCLDDWMRAKGFSKEMEQEPSFSSDDDEEDDDNDANAAVTL
ncbi:hypothetical protein CCACVL1_04875 [Corchorus capsularis]|uniref:HAT C-terminal dimerisation domain-containing protein n=1 Tax=Corchorus capsularis TaxID=210143 RepID=A0A1R3JP07_COCAP|nr:hypothetical protein CCACVL1_04875 [Corchorus capsularis]